MIRLGRIFFCGAVWGLWGCTATLSPGVPAGPVASVVPGAPTPNRAIVVEATVAGTALRPSETLGYYLVLDADGDTATGPRVNGAAALTFPFPDARSYLPFVRDEQSILDRQPVAVDPTRWETYFALTMEAGQAVVWQGLKNPDGSVNERARPLVRGTDWALTGATWRLTLPFSRVETTAHAQWEANLVVARRDERQALGTIIDRWGMRAAPSTYFALETGIGTRTLYDQQSGVTMGANVPDGVAPADCDFTTVTTRVVDLN